MRNRFSITPRITGYILAAGMLCTNMVFSVPVTADTAAPTGQQLSPAVPPFTGDISSEVYNFGAEMSMSGNTMVVGSDTARSNGATVSVYIYDGTKFNFQTKLSPAAGTSFTRFGRTLALDGNTVAVGAYGANGQGIIFVFTGSGSSWVQQAILALSSGYPGDGFADSLSISGDTIIAGAVDTKKMLGQEYVFVRSGTTWSQQAILSTSDSATSAYFGGASSISGDTAVILGWGASKLNGAAYVFARDGSTWSRQARLTGDVDTDFYGGQVSLSGDTFVVSAPSIQKAFVFFRTGTAWALQADLTPGPYTMDSNVCISGDTIAVQGLHPSYFNGLRPDYVFTRSGTVWIRGKVGQGVQAVTDAYWGGNVAVSGTLVVHSMLWVNSPAYLYKGEINMNTPYQQVWSNLYYTNINFGLRLALNGNTAAVATSDLNSPGRVYVFTSAGGAWSQQAMLIASDSHAGDQFGVSIAIDGDTMVVGSNFNDAAYVFTRSGANWTQQARLTAPDISASANFAMSVSISGDTIVVGSLFDNDGAAYVFTRSGTAWTRQAKLTASDEQLGNSFGSAVSVSGDTVIIGASTLDKNVGAAYIFSRSGTAWTQQAKLVASDTADLWFGQTVSISGDTAAVGTWGGPPTFNGPPRTASVYIFTRSGTMWSVQAKLNASDTEAGDYFGDSVSLSGDTLVAGAYAGASGTGAVYIFVRSGGAWSQSAKLTKTGPTPGDCFGFAVSVSGNMVVVGAVKQDLARKGNFVYTVGSAWVFNLAPPAVTTTPPAGTGQTTAPVSSTAEPPSSTGTVVVSTGPSTVANTSATAANPGSSTPVVSPPSNSLVPWLIGISSLAVIIGVVFVIYSRRNKI